MGTQEPGRRKTWELGQREREALWRKRVGAWRQSASSQAAYCRQQALAPADFSWWKHELARRDGLAAASPAQPGSGSLRSSCRCGSRPKTRRAPALWNCATGGVCRSSAAPIRAGWLRWLRRWRTARRADAFSGGDDFSLRSGHRHAAQFRQAGRDDSLNTGAGSHERPSVRVLQSAAGPRQDSVLGSQRFLPVLQTFGGGLVLSAAGLRWRAADRGCGTDADSGRHRSGRGEKTAALFAAQNVIFEP